MNTQGKKNSQKSPIPNRTGTLKKTHSIYGFNLYTIIAELELAIYFIMALFANENEKKQEAHDLPAIV